MLAKYPAFRDHLLDTGLPLLIIAGVVAFFFAAAIYGFDPARVLSIVLLAPFVLVAAFSLPLFVIAVVASLLRR